LTEKPTTQNCGFAALALMNNKKLLILRALSDKKPPLKWKKHFQWDSVEAVRKENQ